MYASSNLVYFPTRAILTSSRTRSSLNHKKYNELGNDDITFASVPSSPSEWHLALDSPA